MSCEEKPVLGGRQKTFTPPILVLSVQFLPITFLSVIDNLKNALMA